MSGVRLKLTRLRGAAAGLTYAVRTGASRRDTARVASPHPSDPEPAPTWNDPDDAARFLASDDRDELCRRYAELVQRMHRMERKCGALVGRVTIENRQALAQHARIRDQVSEREAAAARDLASATDATIRTHQLYAGLLELKGRTLSQLRGAVSRHQALVTEAEAACLDPRGARRVRHVRWRDRRATHRLLQETGLFSADWYRATYPDAAGLEVKRALDHYLQVGLGEDRDPHPLVSAAWIRQGMANGATSSTPPVLAFLKGQAIQSHPLFDAEFYLRRYPDVQESGASPLLHYIRGGAAERRQPHALFDPRWYEERRGAEGPSDLLTDYLVSPDRFAVDPHPLFSGREYLARVPDLVARRVNPLMHYLVVGCRTGVAPHPLFETAYYLDTNPDVAAAGLSPLTHFVEHGAAEGRRPHPLFDPTWYLREYPDVADAGFNALVHYVTRGADEGRRPEAHFPLDSFRQAFGDRKQGDRTPPDTLLSEEGRNPFDPARPDASGWTAHWDELRRHSGETIAQASAHAEFDPDVYDMPESLRGYVDGRHGAAAVTSLYDLLQVVHRYGDRPQEFDGSGTCAELIRRVGEVATSPAGFVVDVSIVLPVHNALVYTLTCLLSVLQEEARYGYEIILADDASTDRTETAFDGLGDRIVHLRHETNLGFLANCNAAAAQARGRYVVFLNNDTLVLPGWLDELIGTFESRPDIGLVGSKLLNADGTLQEAGGIVWRDASAWNYGRNQDPALPEFNYVRDVDYCSGASIALPTAIWRELGGFDRLFSPAYCEDSDLAFRVRAAGYRSLYQPFSELIHHEGRSHGRDDTQGIKAYQVRNGRRIFARWQATLAADHFENGRNVVVARDRSASKPHVIFVDRDVPRPDDGPVSRTNLELIETFLDGGFQVALWLDDPASDDDAATALRKKGVEVIPAAGGAGRFESWFHDRSEWISYVVLCRSEIAARFVEAVYGYAHLRVIYHHDGGFESDTASRPGPSSTANRPSCPGTSEVDLLDLVARSDLTLVHDAAQRDALGKAAGDASRVIEVAPRSVVPDVPGDAGSTRRGGHGAGTLAERLATAIPEFRSQPRR